MSDKRKIIGVIVENQPGVLARIAGLFSSRNFNIESLAVGETEDPTTSRMTIVARGDEIVLEQIEKQLNKLIDVIKVIDMTEEDYVERELALIKINTNGKDKTDIMHYINIFKGKVMDTSHDTIMVEITGNDERINSFLDIIKGFGIKEMVRTGPIALIREKKKRD
ncbi:MAG: acetolactate synthase small subunit [Candidatus Goldbacteria bacterium]|nr:acetolactate synthase small subunit [Candidatus Goldiibacteriota bacterium]